MQYKILSKVFDLILHGITLTLCRFIKHIGNKDEKLLAWFTICQ